jgi:predicted permease
MPQLRRLISRLVAFFRADKADSDLTREIDAHLQLLEDEFVAKGMTGVEARYATRRAFGGIEQAKERQRETRTFARLTGWSIDLKLGVRMMRKTPGLTIVAVFALAVGIGAGATCFEFVTHLFRPKLSFPGADRLVGLLNWDLSKANVEDRSLYEFAEWKAQLTSVQDLGAGWQVEEVLTTEDGHAESARGWEISASAFRAVPAAPLYGRPLLDDDEKLSAEPVIVIGEDLWEDLFDSDPHAVGRTVRFGEAHRTVVGVMPRSFGFPLTSAFWTPLHLNPATLERAEGPAIRMFGRLAPGADLKQAQAELETISGRRQVRSEISPPATRPSIHLYVDSFWKDFWRSTSTTTLLLLAYSINLPFIALLGICAANVAQLIFARTMAREGEITVRRALGASRGRIVGQFVAEALVLASVGAVAGVAGTTPVLRQIGKMLLPGTLPFWWNEQIRIETIAYIAVLVIIAALVMGGVPALRATGSRMNARLKDAGAAGATMRLGKLWTGVIVAQIAVTTTLLLGVVSGGWIVYRQNAGAAQAALPQNEYFIGSVLLERGATPERQMAVRRELQRRLNADADVINATFAVELPGEVDEDTISLELSSPTDGPPGALTVREAVPIASGYFETFRLPLVAGREFTPSEIEERRNVVIVDETFVRLVLGGRNAIGQLVRESRTEQNGAPGPWREIVGVVGDVVPAPDKTTKDAMIYRPAGPNNNDWRLVVHASRNPLARVRAIAAETDREIRLGSMMTIERERENDHLAVRRLLTVIWIIAAATLMLAAAGIHSLISFTLATRTREIGIRTALGAAPFRIVRGILLPAFTKVVIGIALGGIPGIVFIQARLDWGISARIMVAVAVSVAAFVVAIAAISSVWPVRRALKIQPTDALRTT